MLNLSKKAMLAAGLLLGGMVIVTAENGSNGNAGNSCTAAGVPQCPARTENGTGYCCKAERKCTGDCKSCSSQSCQQRKGSDKVCNERKGCGNGKRRHGRCGYGHRHRRSHHNGYGLGYGMRLSKLNLSREQWQKISAIRMRNKSRRDELHSAVRDARRALREAAQADSRDKNKVEQLSKALAEKLAALALFQGECQREIEAILTPEQRKQLEQYKQDKLCTEAQKPAACGR